MKNEDFFNLSLDIMCVINENNKIEHANKSWERILGYKAKEIESINFTELIHPEDLDETLKAMKTLKNNGEISNFINRYKKINGEFCYLEWRATYHNNKIYATAREVSEKIRIKNKLKSSEDNFKNFFETIDSMIFVADRNCNIIYVNSKVEERLNYKKNELLGKNFVDMHEKERRCEAEEILRDILKTRKGKCPLPLETKDGNLIPVDTSIWFGEWDNKPCIYAISKDLTLEQENLQKFNKIFQNNPSIMAINDLVSGKFVEVNNLFLKKLGYKNEEVIGRTIRDLKIVVKDKVNKAIEDEIVTKGRIRDFELKYKTKKGEERNGLLFAEIIDSGSEKYVINMLVDITKDKEKNEILEYKNNFQELLIEIISEFINLPFDKTEKFIYKALKKIGEFVSADRIYIFDYDLENYTMTNTFELTREGIRPKKDLLINTPIKKHKWVEKHKKGKPIIIPKVNKYESKNEIREILDKEGIKSIFSVPMMDGKECIGFVGFDAIIKHKKYKKEEINLLKLFAKSIVDVRKKVKKDHELRNSIEEKSTLMKEIHHRVKNNLQLVSSLLFLQSTYIKDGHVKKILKETENRVRSMAILHEKIYRNKEIANINFKEYIEEILEELLISYKIDKKIKLYADIKDVDLNIDKAINCGLIVNELITNSIQHAFNDVEKGEIKIKIFQEADKEFIIISDDGLGFKEDYEDVKTKSLGLQIVESLVKQLKGTIKKENNYGTKFTIEFKIK